jgi:hypothetical protein
LLGGSAAAASPRAARAQQPNCRWSDSSSEPVHLPAPTFTTVVQERANALLVRRSGGAPRASHDPRFAGVHRDRRSCELWHQSRRDLSPSRLLRRQSLSQRSLSIKLHPAALDGARHTKRVCASARGSRAIAWLACEPLASMCIVRWLAF